MKIKNRTIGMLLALVMVFASLCTGVLMASAAGSDDFQEGTYTGTAQKSIGAMGSTVSYDITLTLSDGSYSYSVDITVSGGMSYSGTETDRGTYTVEGNTLTMTGGDLTGAAVGDEGKLTITGKLSSFAGASDTAELTFSGTVDPSEPGDTYDDVLVSGNYVLTADSYYEGAMMKLPVYIIIDAEKDTFIIHPYTDNVPDLDTNKGSGTISFDETSGIYTMTYTAGSTGTSTFTATADGITFKTPMHYGSAMMNTVDEDGNFIPYTAKKLSDVPAEEYDDVLVSGNYALTTDSYPEEAGIKTNAYIIIDAEKDTFAIHPYSNNTPDLDEDKGTGTISFDKATGVYTMTYSDNAAKTSTFTATKDSITFTSPMYYGAGMVNTGVGQDHFLPYTAKLLDSAPVDPPEPGDTYDDVLVSGNYVLTADSYYEGAMMKLPVYIIIDAEKDTFIIHPYTDNVPDLDTNKGSGTISFDETSGIYTMTYTAGSTGTSTFTATADGITFKTPMHYGSAMMNTVDEDGNFIPYTAKKLSDVPEPAPDPEKYDDVLVSGNYILTADSYYEGAMMKLPVYIIIDAEKDTFIIHPYTDNVPDLDTNKGSGTISFDETSGIYTMTYTAGSTGTSTFTATADGITFKTPMHYGSAMMNTVDEDGNFVPYTAKKLSDGGSTERPGGTEKPNDGKDDPKVPVTGDSTSLIICAVLLLVSGAGISATLYVRRKNVK